MARLAPLLIATGLLLGARTAQASYAQFWFDTRPLFAVAGLMAGAAVGTVDILYWRTRHARSWSKGALVATALLLPVLPLALLSGYPPLSLLAILLGCVTTALWVPQLFGTFGLPAWQRAALLGVAGLAMFGLWDAPRPRDNDPGWFFGPLLLVWGGMTLLGGNGQPSGTDPIETVKNGDRSAHPPPHWWITLSHVAQTLRDAMADARDRLGTLAFKPSALLRGLLAFLICYGVGALLITIGAGPLADLMLALAGTFPGAPEAPTHDNQAALMFWFSHGPWPSSWLALLTLPLWRRIGPRE